MGTVIQLKNQINNSYFQLRESVEDKLVLTEEKIKLKLNSDVKLVQKMTDFTSLFSFNFIFSSVNTSLSSTDSLS